MLGSISRLQRALVDSYQHAVPIVERPFDVMGRRLDASEARVLAALTGLRRRGLIDRVGPVFRPGRVGASTLAAMSVPAARLEAVADTVSAFEAVNHNYEREHAFNLWFVVTAADADAVASVLDAIRAATGIDVLDLPLEHSYHIDLGFAL